MLNNFEIFNENCIDTLNRMEDDTVDLVITSPPYNMNLRIRNGKYCSRQINPPTKEFTTKYKGFNNNLPIDEFYEFHLNVLKELLRVSPIVFYNIQVVTGSKRAFFKIIGELNEYLKDIIVWDKGHAQPAMGEGILNRQTELILVFDKNNAISRKFDKNNFERGTLNDIWLIKRGAKSKELKNHSAIFPEALVEKILINFSNEGDMVYDPFTGSGTTGVVARKLNRKFIGSEILKEYADLARKRIQDVK